MLTSGPVGGRIEARAGASVWLARVLALVAGVALAFGDVLSPGRGLTFRDHILVFRPRWWGVVEAVSDGRWPGLTHASPGGVPLELMLNATWTPPTALLWLGDFATSYDLLVAGHYVLLALGALALARALGADRDQALLGAAVATLAGPVISSENLFVMLQGLAWAPWVGLGLCRLAARPSLGAASGTALALGFHLQGITPVVMVLDLAAVLALALWLRPGRRAVGLAALAAAVGLAVAAVELLPPLWALGQTARGQGFAYEAQSGWALNPPMFVELWVPSFWAPPEHPALNVPWATGRDDDPPYFATLYLGTALTLAVAGGWARRAQKGLWLAFGLALLVAMGRHTPLHQWLVSLPILSSSRYAVKYTLLMTAALAPLCALAVPVVMREPRRLLIAALAQAGLLLATFVVITSPEYADALQELLRPVRNGIRFEGVGRAELQASLIEAQQARLVVCMAAALALAGVAMGLERFRARGPALLAVVVLMDLALAASATVHGADLEAKRLPEAAQAALADDVQRYGIEVPGGVMTVAHRAGATRFDDMMRSLGQRGHHAFDVARVWMDLDLDGQSNPTFAQACAWVAAAPRPAAYRMMARLGVARLVSPSGALPLEHTLSWPVQGEAPQHLYRLPAVRPYVSAFTGWRAATLEALTPAGYLAHLVGDDQIALVTHGLTESATVAGCAGAEVAWARPRPERVEATVNAACTTVVVLQEVAHPGWGVWVDDAPAPLLQAEAGYVAAQVGPGPHRVRFEFEPRSWPLLGLSLSAALVALAAGALAAVRARLARTGGGATRLG